MVALTPISVLFLGDGRGEINNPSVASPGILAFSSQSISGAPACMSILQVSKMRGANNGELQLVDGAVGVDHLEVFGGDVDDLLALR